MSQSPFRLRVRIGDKEVELGGARDEVISTLEDLNEIVDRVAEAFSLEAKVKGSEAGKASQNASSFPKIARTAQCGDAVTALLSTDWGKTPRTIAEIREAMDANAIFFPKTTLSGVLVWLVKKNKIRRWKDKRRGYVYTLHDVEEEI